MHFQKEALTRKGKKYIIDYRSDEGECELSIIDAQYEHGIQSWGWNYGPFSVKWIIYKDEALRKSKREKMIKFAESIVTTLY